MGFSPVKSDPWKKGLLSRRRRRHLWSGGQWTELVRQAHADYRAGFRPDPREYPVSDACVALIREYNEAR